MICWYDADAFETRGRFARQMVEEIKVTEELFVDESAMTRSGGHVDDLYL
jgi:hypothetical protein